MHYLDDEELELSPVIANCRMNRERDLGGTNGYDAEIGFQPLSFLEDRSAKNGKARWLDLCCGTGRALVQATSIIEGTRLPIEITGVDLAGMFMPHSLKQLRLIETSLTTWNPAGPFDLITSIHGLHYIGDKLGLIARACSWLNSDGVFIANLDNRNLRLNPGGSSSGIFVRELRQAGIQYRSARRLVTCAGHRELCLPFVYIGADDKAGPNYTKQPAVNSHYERRQRAPALAAKHPE